MTALRPGLPPPPPRIARLPVDARGYPVPWFVAWIDGVPDHRVADGEKLRRALGERLCWTCGQRLGAYLAFLIGPMCAINRVSAEPPQHAECATYSARACPFLTTPHERRREKGLPEEARFSESGLKRNPGVALVWVTKSYEPFPGLNGEALFRIGKPTETFWFAEGRPALRAEVEASIASGLPALRAMAEADGQSAVSHLFRQCEAAERLFPAL